MRGGNIIAVLFLLCQHKICLLLLGTSPPPSSTLGVIQFSPFLTTDNRIMMQPFQACLLGLLLLLHCCFSAAVNQTTISVEVTMGKTIPSSRFYTLVAAQQQQQQTDSTSVVTTATSTSTSLLPMISLALVTPNATWNHLMLESQISFTSFLAGYDDPLGLTSLYQNWGLGVMSVSTSPDARVVNITLSQSACYLPKQDDVIYMTLGPNVTNVYGANLVEVNARGIIVNRAAANSTLSISVTANVDSTSNVAGLTLVAICCICCAIAFLMGNWFDALHTLTQLQFLIVVSFTSCAPRYAAVIFNKSVWILWPLSTRSKDVTNPEDQGRMTFNFIFIGVMFLVQCIAVFLFSQFSGKTSPTSRRHAFQDPSSRAKFPNGTLLVAGFLFQGSVMSSAKTFALHYLGFLGSSSAGPLALAICTMLFLCLQLIFMWWVVFRVVSQLVYMEPLTKSLFTWAFIGGQWPDQDARSKWGVLFESLNGSSFWFLASLYTLYGLSSTFAGFVPGDVSSCKTQFYLILMVQLIHTILVFVRRPFSSLVNNILTLGVCILQLMVVIAFVSTMECSRMQSQFAPYVVWFALVIIVLKSMVVMILQAATRIRQMMQSPIILTNGVRNVDEVSVSPRRPNDWESQKQRLLNVIARKRNGGGAAEQNDSLADELLQELEATHEETKLFGSLEDTMDSAMLKFATMWKPLLPQPLILNGNVVSREIGFGGEGGLRASEGPSVAIRITQPCGMCCDSDCIYFVEAGNHRIMGHSFLQRRCVTLCGGQLEPGYAGDMASDSRSVAMSQPRFVTMGHRCLYVSDSGNDCVRRVDITTGGVVTVVGGHAAETTLSLSRPMGLCCINHSLYIVDSGNHRVMVYDFQENTATVVCGTGYPGFDSEGIHAAASRLNAPQGLCIRHSDGTMFIADTGNHRVVSVDPRTRCLRVVVGKSGIGGECLGGLQQNLNGRDIELCFPTDVAVGPDNSLLVVDGGNAKVWIVNRFGFARVILPPNDTIIPRHIVVPTKYTVVPKGRGESNDPQQQQDGDYSSLSRVSSATRGDNNASWFRGGSSLSNAVASMIKAQDGGGNGRAADASETTAFVFYVSDSIHHVIVAVDASVQRNTTFTKEHLYAMAHPETMTRYPDRKTSSSSVRQRMEDEPQPPRGSSVAQAQGGLMDMTLGNASPIQRADERERSLTESFSFFKQPNQGTDLAAAATETVSSVYQPNRRTYERPAMGRHVAVQLHKTVLTSPRSQSLDLPASVSRRDVRADADSPLSSLSHSSSESWL